MFVAIVLAVMALARSLATVLVTLRDAPHTVRTVWGYDTRKLMP